MPAERVSDVTASSGRGGCWCSSCSGSAAGRGGAVAMAEGVALAVVVSVILMVEDTSLLEVERS